MRELLWAADARQSAEWVRAACMAATVAGAFGARVDPAKLVPEQYRGEANDRPRSRTREEEEREADLGWRILEHGLRAV